MNFVSNLQDQVEDSCWKRFEYLLVLQDQVEVVFGVPFYKL